jgi:DivIVA domain-containing protein
VAISFSRPDPSSPAAVADANFPTSRRGFDQQQVRDFLRMVAAELARSQERERYLEQEVRARRQEPQAAALPVELDDETVARLLGEETTRILQAARESSAATRAKAEEAADRLLRDAREEAQRMREDIETEVARRRKDSENEAAAELESAKQQGREMVEEARAYREKALSELARRRDLARQQIDHLVHARERLVQAFERARLAAADVVAELAPLGEFDEYVNLTPTTGPVPMMVPASRLADASAISDDALRLRADPDEQPAEDTSGDSTAEIVAEPTATGAQGDVTGADADDSAATEPAESTEGGPAITDAAAHAEPAQAAVAPDAVEPAEAPADEPTTPVSENAAEDAPAEKASAEGVGRNATVLQFPAARVAAVPADDTPGVDDTADATDTADTPDAEVTGADEIDDDDVTASDVDSLFARLRAQQDETVPVAADAAGPTASAVFERRDEALTPLIVASGRKLKRVLADEQNAALDLLRRNDPITTLDALVGDEVTHLGRYYDAISTELMTAATAGSASLGSGDVAGTVLAPAGQALRDDLIRPLRERLAERIASGAGDNEAVAKSARAIYREWKTKHIDDHLDDLLRIAYNRGALAAVPAGTPVRWIADPSVGACSECEDNTLQGAVPAGDAFPTGHVTAPAHSGCRCSVVLAER